MHIDDINDAKIKELHMDTYINEPYMLLARVIDENRDSRHKGIQGFALSVFV